MNILTDATPADLGRAVEANLWDLFRAMAQTLGGECEETSTWCRHHSFPTNPMFKGVWRPRLASSDVDAAVDEAIAWFRERGAPYFFWWTGPDSAPVDLGRRLQGRGLLDMAEQQASLASGIAQIELGAPLMALELARADESLLRSVPPGFVIEEVKDDAGLEDFKAVFVETYGIPEWAGQAWLDATRAVGIGKTPWRMLLGRLDGRAVATSMLFCGGGIASVYAVAALPSVRGKGIGGAITLRPLLDAQRDGFRYAGLFSTEMGVRAYERIGFRTVPGRINRYLWRAG